VLAIGSPFDLQSTITAGIVSAKARQLGVIPNELRVESFIQTDAAVNPGNSGGALLDAEGKLIGINSSKLVDESFEGMGFAIPVNHMKEVVTDIIENKDNPSPYIGIEIATYNSAYLDKFGYPHGAVIKSVVEGGPADKARLQAGDIITELNSVAIEEYTDFFDEFEKCEPESKVAVKIYRNGRYYTTTVTVGSNNSR
jgi:S1-C subfamily serine protease